RPIRCQRGRLAEVAEALGHHDRLAVIRFLKPRKDFEQCGLAGTVLADDPDPLSRADREVDAVEQEPVAATAVRDATLAELTEHGYAGLTVENVAERSGVHKTTIYRRWGGVDGLIVNALDLAAQDNWAPPDTGSLEGDLTGFVHEVLEIFNDPVEGLAPA